MRARLLGLLLLSSACPPPFEDTRCFSIDPLFAAPGMPVVAEQGPAQVRLESLLACPFPVTVEVEVQDPSSNTLPASVTLDQQPSRIAADVSFTPVGPGRYLVIGRFQPTMEVVQLLVEVAKTRPTRDEPRLVDAMPFDPSGCTGLARTLEGSVVCTQRSSTVVIHDGGITDQLLAGPVFVSGNTVWLARSQQVDRYVDDAGTLVAMGKVVPLQGFADGGFFGDDAAILIDGTSPRGPFRWNGQALVNEAKPFAPDALVVFMLGERSYAQGAGNTLCEVKTGPRSCTDGVNVVGVTPDEVWTGAFSLEQSVEVRRADITVPQLSRSFRGLRGAPLSEGLIASISASSVPQLVEDGSSFFVPAAKLVPRMKKNSFVLEAWPLTTLELGRDFVLLEKSSRSVTWVAR